MSDIAEWRRDVLAWLSTNERSKTWLARRLGVSRSHLTRVLAGSRASEVLRARMMPYIDGSASAQSERKQ